jgi:hypothetical protein
MLQKEVNFKPRTDLHESVPKASIVRLPLLCLNLQPRLYDIYNVQGHCKITVNVICSSKTNVPAGVVRYAAGMPLTASAKHQPPVACIFSVKEGNSRDSRCAQRLQERQLFTVISVLENIFAQVGVRSKVDSREGNITK